MPADPADIIRRINAGESPKDIAAAMGVSLRRVYQIRGEAPREKLDDAKVEEIRRAVALGMSQREAAAQFRCSRTTVSALCASLDVMPRPKNQGQLPADVIAHILSRHRAGRTATTIASELADSVRGILPQTVRSVIRRHADVHIDTDDSIMRAVADELARRGMTAHGFAELLPGGVPTREKLYEYLRGDDRPSSLVASRMLAALGIRLAPPKED